MKSQSQRPETGSIKVRNGCRPSNALGNAHTRTEPRHFKWSTTGEAAAGSKEASAPGRAAHYWESAATTGETRSERKAERTVSNHNLRVSRRQRLRVSDWFEKTGLSRIRFAGQLLESHPLKSSKSEAHPACRASGNGFRLPGASLRRCSF